jgi:hypothetical protein
MVHQTQIRSDIFMKEILLALLAFAAVPSAFAQGISGIPINNLFDGSVYEGSVGGRLAGGDLYSVTAYWGVIGTPEDNLVPIAAATVPLFGTTGSDGSDGAGKFDFGVVGFPAGTVLIQIRGFQTSFGNYDNSPAKGRSPVVTCLLPPGPVPIPPDPPDFGDWAIVVPEPSTLALGVSAAAAMFIVRRRN